MSEWDCVPATFINALCYLYERAEIPPQAVRSIYEKCLDHKLRIDRPSRGTSKEAVEELCRSLPQHFKAKKSLKAAYLRGANVSTMRGGTVEKGLRGGGVALVRTTHWGDIWHYSLLVQISAGWAHFYDPYFKPRSNVPGHYEYITGAKGQEPNLRVALVWLEVKGNLKPLRLGSVGERECVLLQRVTV